MSRASVPDSAAQTAFDPAAPAAERYDAQAELQQAHAPRAISDLIPPEAIRPVIQFIEDQYAEQALLAKAAKVIPFPGRPRNPKGMQSLYLDGLQIFAYGDYFERPTPVGFDALRLMVEQTPILNAVIMTRVRQVCRFTQPQEDDGLGFAIRHIDREHTPTKSEQASLRDLARFVTHCGWEFNPRARRRLKRDSFSQCMAKAVRESLVYDSMPIETEAKRGARGGIDGFYAVDGSTIRLCTDDGYDGDDEICAVQVVQGRVVTAYTHDDLIYEVRNPRADVRLAGYGLGETELLIRVVTGFLNALTVNLKGFSDNSIPRGILHLNGEYAQEDLAAFRRYWNAMVRGINNAWTLPILVSRDADSKATFEKLDAGFDEMMFSKWMTFLVSIVCAVYGMSPTEINFDSFTAGNTSALAGSDTGEKLAASKDSGLRPLMAYLESLISDFIVADFDEKYVFRWAGLDEEDEQRRFEIQKLAMTVNEMRALENLPALDGPLGEAPVNPSLIGPWMQLTQGGGADGGDAAAPEAGADAGAEAEAAPQDADDAPVPAADQPESGEGMKPAPGASGGGKKASGGAAPVADADEPDDAAMQRQLRALSERALGKKLAKANPHHGRDGRFSFATGEIAGLFDKPDLAVTESRHQVRPDERLSEAGARAKREIMLAFANADGFIRNRDTRHPIMVTGKSASHIVHLSEGHAPFKQHIEAAFCLPDLVKMAVLAERYPDRKDDNQDLYIARYYAPFLCDGVLYRAKLTVFEYRGDDKKFKLYDHALSEVELTALEKTNPARGGVVRRAGFQNGERNHVASTSDNGDPLRSPAPRLTVRQMLEGVNRDSDGLPFGSPADGDTFAKAVPLIWSIEA